MENRLMILPILLALTILWLPLECLSATEPVTNISGRVLTETAPLDGAQVYIYRNYDDIRAGRHIQVSAAAGPDGVYNSSLPQGKYYFVARGSRNGKDYFSYHGNNPVRIGGEDTWITMLANPVEKPVFSEAAEGDTFLKGVVTYKGQPLKDAYVTAYKAGTGTFKGLGFRTESVSEEGRFEFPLQPGNYVVVAKRIESGKGNRPPKSGDLYCYCPNNPVEVLADKATTVEVPCYPKDNRSSFTDIPQLKTGRYKTIDQRDLNGSSGIKGKVTNSSGKPVAGILVLAYRTTKPVFLTYHLSHGTEYSSETAADGSFFIPLDVGGDFYLVARNTLGDGPHRGELFGLYNGNSRHVVAFKQGTVVDSVDITAGRVMDESGQSAELSNSTSEANADMPGQSRFDKESSKISDTVLTEDTVWRGDVVISGVVVVKKGVTLTVMPGTSIRFAKVDRDQNNVGDGELRVEGRIVARGTAAERIAFTSAEKSKSVRDWSYIHLLASQENNVFEYCRFEYGFSGVQVHYSNVRIEDCLFSNNHEGLHFNTANVVAEHNTFTGNGSAIRFKRLEGRVVIRNNEIYGNEVGVLFGRQQINAVDFKNLNNPIDYPLFAKNSFHNNRKYNFSMGEGQSLDIKVENNWWGSDQPVKISEGIFDKGNDSELGEIFFKPFLLSPLQNSGVRGGVVNMSSVK